MEVLRSIQIYGFFHEERFIFEYDRLIKAKKKIYIIFVVI